jgi:hypothetical protein
MRRFLAKDTAPSLHRNVPRFCFLELLFPAARVVTRGHRISTLKKTMPGFAHISNLFPLWWGSKQWPIGRTRE